MYCTPPEENVVRVFVVADVRLYREGLVSALGARPGFAIVGEAAVASAVRADIATARPHVIIFDVSSPLSLVQISQLRDAAPDLQVIAFAVGPSSADIIACAEAGAAGYVTTDASLDQLAAAILAAVAGELVCTPQVAHELFCRVGAPRAKPTGRDDAALTARERQVLRLMADGSSNKDIARALNISVSTVKNHVHQVLVKTAAGSRGQAARRATPTMLASLQASTMLRAQSQLS